MREFFCGWRRKVGFVTLLMAVCLQVLWFRSHVVADTVAICIGEAIEVETSQGMFEILHNNIGYVDDMGIRHTWVPAGLSWRSELPNLLSIGGPTSYFRCSLLWFVILFSFLSVYLLLWKPRKRI